MIDELINLTQNTIEFLPYKEKYARVNTSKLGKPNYSVFIAKLENGFRVFDGGSTLTLNPIDFNSDTKQLKFSEVLKQYDIQKENKTLFTDCEGESLLLTIFQLIDAMTIIFNI